MPLAASVLADRRPWLAGALLGLATFNPQLGLLIPIALLAGTMAGDRRRGR
jgi:uncharacterized membrane protein